MKRIITLAITLVLAACGANPNVGETTTTSAVVRARPAAPVWSPSPLADDPQMPFDLPSTLQTGEGPLGPRYVVPRHKIVNTP